MKKIILIISMLLILFVSCVSTTVEVYSDINMKGKTIYLSIDKQTTSVTSGGIGVPVGGTMLVSASTETFMLGSIKDVQLIRQNLIDKGYDVVNNPDDADIILVGESDSSVDLSRVRLGFFDKDTGDLVMVCEGTYGLGWDMQDDLNKALKKALESIPKL